MAFEHVLDRPAHGRLHRSPHRLIPAPTHRPFERSFATRVVWRLALLGLLLAARAAAMVAKPLPATALVLAGAVAWVWMSLLAEVRRTNLEVARLASALRHRDHTAEFGGMPDGAGFAELRFEFEALLAEQRDTLTALQASRNHIAALVEQVPIPLLVINAEEQVQLLNQAARRLFNRPHGNRLDDLHPYGQQLVDGLRQDLATQSIEMRPADDAAVRLRMTQATVVHLGRPQRLVALQPVQTDIDRAERALSESLVRVLTHEVMNSLTPVTSLANSAADLAGRLPASAPATAVQAATATVARRAHGLMQFVARYREVSQSPPVHKATVAAHGLSDQLERLFRAEWGSSQVTLRITIDPPDLELHADRTLLEPVLLNLLRNAAQAAEPRASQPLVALRMARAHRGGTLIDIDDNGPGIPAALRDEVFLPFFTTKPAGHGVGLSLARQIVLAHGGSIRIEDSPLGGACVRIVL